MAPRISFANGVDLHKIPVHNLVVEGSNTPPANPVTGMLWNDTTLANNAVMKYFDGDEWVRQDGGGDIPNGMIEDRHIADDAAIQWTKIAAPTGNAAFVTTGDYNTEVADIRADFAAADTALRDDLEDADDAINTRIDNIAADLTGDYVTLATSQTVSGDKTFTGTVIVPVGDAPTEAVQLSQLTSLQSTLEGALDTRADAIEAAATTLTGRVTAAEGVNTAQNTRLDDLEAADTAADTRFGELEDDLASEVARATTREDAIEDAFEAGDLGLGTRITDETTARAAADTTLQANITAEANARTAADNALGTRIDDAEDALDDEVAARDAAIAVETDRATTAEAALDGRLDTLEAVDNLTQAEFNTFNTANTAALALKADLVDGKVPLSQLPSVRTDDVYVVVWDDLDPVPADADEALDTVTGADEGDVAVINGGPGGAFINTGDGWAPLSSGASGATDAEVQAAVAAEAAARTAADNALDGRLDTLEAVDYATQAELDAEVTTLEGADTALGTRIDTEHAHHQADLTTIRGELATAVGALEDADDTLTAAVDAERTRAEDAEADLSDRITTEVSDRTAADTSIRTDFAAADTALAGTVTAEATARTNADTALGTRIDTEHTHHTDLATRLDGDIADLEGDLADEVTARTTADTALGDRITTLEGSTTAADLTALTTRVTTAEGDIDALEADVASVETSVATEATTRANADTALQAAIDAEIDARTTAVSTEATARTTGDTNLGTRIDTLTANTTTELTALGNRITTEETAKGSADTAIRTDFGAADTAIRGEFAAADTAVRGEFAAADTTLQNDINTRALDSSVVHKTGNETVAGVKTFTSPVGVPTGAVAAGDAVNLAQLQAFVEEEAFDSSDIDTALAALDTRADALEAHDEAETTRVDDALALKADLVGGKVPTSQLPALALTNVQVVADDAARDALTGLDEGDVVVVTSSGTGDGAGRASFIYDGTALVPLSSPADVTEDELAAAVEAGLADLEADLTDRLDGLDAGAGLTRTDDRFDVVGTAGRITVNADSVDIASDYAGQASIVTVGTVTTGTWNGTTVALNNGGTGYAATDLADLVDHLELATAGPGIYAETLSAMVEGTEAEVEHGLGSLDVQVQLYDVTTGLTVFSSVRRIDVDTVGVEVESAYTEGGDLRIVVIGGPVGVDGRGVERQIGRLTA